MTVSNAASPAGPRQGVIVRADPVPAGRYWAYIDESEVEKWQAWVKASGGAVKTIVMEPQREVYRWIPAVFVTRLDLSIIQSVVGYWVLFDVLAPTKWIGLGYPTSVVDTAVRSSVDVMTAPAPEPESNPVGDLLSQVKMLLLLGLGVYVGGHAISSWRR